MSHTTQCPNCQTCFKVNDQQLSAANGLVRCGRCAHVFDANEHFIAQPEPVAAAEHVAPAPSPAASASSDHFELEVPDFDPLEQATEQAAEHIEIREEADDESNEEQRKAAEVAEFQRALSEAMQNRQQNTPSVPLGNPFELEDPSSIAEPAFAVSADQSSSSATETTNLRPEASALPQDELTAAAAADKPRRPFVFALALIASIIGLLLLAGQLIYFNRTRIAAEVAELRQPLELACKQLGCTVPWPTDPAYIRTEWSELAFVPDYPNLIQLSATLKNHANYAQAYPWLELSLKDEHDQVLIRKVFSPKEYLKPNDLQLGRFNPASEIKVTMRLDTGEVRAMGYSLYWFYP
ncbi:DUF3426 domain-containing protein [Neisseriaceae bacterium TC5R-5]|nr:DUF3426 domain-containing protein [Neisseriaceae bacterium TC5R-5]